METMETKPYNGPLYSAEILSLDLAAHCCAIDHSNFLIMCLGHLNRLEDPGLYREAPTELWGNRKFTVHKPLMFHYQTILYLLVDLPERYCPALRGVLARLGDSVKAERDVVDPPPEGPEPEHTRPSTQRMRAYPRPLTSDDTALLEEMRELRRIRGFTKNIAREWQPVELVNGGLYMHIISLARITGYAVESLFERIEEWLATSPGSSPHVLRLPERRDDGWLPYSEVWFDEKACLALCHRNGGNKGRIKSYFDMAAKLDMDGELDSKATEAEKSAKKGKEIEPVPMGGELRIRDYDLGVRLGYKQPGDIRELIKRHEASLREMGALPTIPNGLRGAASAEEYYLNRKQAVFITAKSETKTATDITIEIIHKFDSYEKGEVSGGGINSKDLGEAISTELRPIMTELGVMKDQNATLIAIVKAQSDGIRALQDMVAHVAQLQTKRRTKWSDVVTALTPVITRCSEVGSAKSMQIALNQFTPVVGNMVGNAAWAAAEALHEGTVPQKIAERKARRKTRRGEAQTAPSEADDGLELDFDFDG